MILSATLAPTGYETIGGVAHTSQYFVLLNDEAPNLVY